MRKFAYLSIAALFIAIAFNVTACGANVSNLEKPDYTVIKKEGNIEIRKYNPILVAEVTVAEERSGAINTGFKKLAGYIFGGNVSKQDIAMTSPVMQQKSEKIAMTAPVMAEAKDDAWKIRFMMPKKYTLTTLPKPNDDSVSFKELPAKYIAAITFSGRWTDKMMMKKQSTLDEFLKVNNLTPQAAAVWAFYNPPWILPPLRRNEILIEISKTAK